MSTKRTMTLNLGEAEMAVLEELSAKKELSKTAVLRQALRVYQLLEERRAAGDKLILENEPKGEKMELVVL